jgi:hypothetical protein
MRFTPLSIEVLSVSQLLIKSSEDHREPLRFDDERPTGAGKCRRKYLDTHQGRA